MISTQPLSPTNSSRTLRRAKLYLPEDRALFWRALIATRADAGPTVARIALGATVFAHGAQKLFGWFGGYGFTGTMHWFTGTMHIPWILGFAAILAETLGALALIAGFASRVSAILVAIVMTTAAVTVHAQHGFFMNWFGNQKGEGLEFFGLALALAGVVAIHGGGALSIDGRLSRSGNPPGGEIAK